MFKNKKIIIIIGLIIFFVFFIFFFFFFFFFSTNNYQSSNNLKKKNLVKKTLPSLGSDKKTVTVIKDINNKITKKNNDKVVIKNIAVFVAENMGSYSTDTYNFVNLRNVKFLSTRTMKNYIDNLIVSYQKNKQAKNNYYGVTTKALSVIISNPEKINEGGPVEVIVSTQKIETKGSNNLVITTKYKKMIVEVVRDNNKWLVNSAKW